LAKDIGTSDFKDATAENSNKAISQFLATNSHEIRTLMTRIIGMTDLTLMTKLTDEQLNYLTILKSSTGLLLKSFNAMKDYSKLYIDKIQLKHVSFDVKELIPEVVNIFNVAAKQKNILLSIDRIDKNIPKHLMGDPLRLKQVLSTLLGSGLKFTNHDKVSVSVDLEELDRSNIRLKFMVYDSGLPIIFRNIDDEDTRKFGGTGLTTSKELVELMGGDLYVGTHEGGGSQFCFTAVFGVQEPD